MKNWNRIAFTLGLVAVFGACSSSKTAQNSDNAGSDSLPQATDAATDSVPAPTDGAVPPPADAKADAAPPAPTDNSAAPPPVADAAAPAPAPVPAPATEPAASNDKPVHDSSGEWDNYTVQKGDTLMKIAFENYGDLYQWKNIYDANKDAIKNPNWVPPGTVLKIEKPSTPVSVERNGEKYLIKVGDTLGRISDDVYGTKRKWKRLAENNKALIKDPNRIFAGFYLYYQFNDQDKADFEKYKGGTTTAPALSQNSVPADTANPPQAVANPQPVPGDSVAQAQPQAPTTDVTRAPASAGDLQDMMKKLQSEEKVAPPANP